MSTPKTAGKECVRAQERESALGVGKKEITGGEQFIPPPPSFSFFFLWGSFLLSFSRSQHFNYYSIQDKERQTRASIRRRVNRWTAFVCFPAFGIKTYKHQKDIIVLLHIIICIWLTGGGAFAFGHNTPGAVRERGRGIACTTGMRVRRLSASVAGRRGGGWRELARFVNT